MNRRADIPRKGDIRLIDHRPTDDPLTWKTRPVLVLSSKSIFHTFYVAPFSTQFKHYDPDALEMVSVDMHTQGTNLKKASIIKLYGILVYPAKELGKKIGVYPDMPDIDRRLRTLFAL